MMTDSGISIFNNHGIGGIIGPVYAPVVIINISSTESLAGLESTLHKIIAEFDADDRVKLLDKTPPGGVLETRTGEEVKQL